ncbi:filamentation induced by cAMP protein fic [Bifidobacterium dolichotidis]|uniref:protein adenylyltransferase n=1 Tax=Bifidobacterium dolichotidis TaxID=2306976 RepID=A0A430FTG0_9BIFI|nr:Fic family protein [Bifidobacterium dolichotidis]RSX56172.1 filamentation induced by cAMP protein fic [Bifidobacterium dolichotidis]
MLFASTYEVINGNGDTASRSFGWTISFELQQVEGLSPSQYAREIAQQNIAGHIDYAQAQQRIAEYHANHPYESAHRRADLVALRISEFLQTPTFAFAPKVLAVIHQLLFQDVLPHDQLGHWRQEDLLAPEQPRSGEAEPSTNFVPSPLIEPSLSSLFRQEKERQFSYFHEDKRAVAHQLCVFMSNIWRVHPFDEGNTCAIATFMITYFRHLGFTIHANAFAEHRQCLKEVLIQANAPTDLDSNIKSLEDFVGTVLF